MNVIYLLIVIVGSNGVTSQLIPQVNMKQCQINAKMLTLDSSEIPHQYRDDMKTNKAFCIHGYGVK